MTDIERLRKIADDIDYMVSCDCGCTRRSCPSCGTELLGQVDTTVFRALLADYERLRGMEERVKGAATGEVVEVGDDEEGQPRVLIHSTREDLAKGPAILFRTVALVPVTGGEGPRNLRPADLTFDEPQTLEELRAELEPRPTPEAKET